MAPKISNRQQTEHKERMRRLQQFREAEDRREKAALQEWYEQMAKQQPDVYHRTDGGGNGEAGERRGNGYRRGHEISRNCPCDRCDAWFRTHGEDGGDD